MSDPMPPRAAVFDLRQYRLVPGRRDELIELFDRYFVPGQEAAGMHVVGQFRDLDDPDRFVWLRSFSSLAARTEALTAFYGGTVWQAHRDAANATMVDSDDALLLRPLSFGRAYVPFGFPRPQPDDATSLIEITVLYRDAPVPAADERFVAYEVLPALTAAGAEVVAALASEDAPNGFPALPLREEHVLAWVVRTTDDDAYARYREALDASPDWRDRLWPRAFGDARRPAQRLRLRPTRGSHLR